MPKTWSEVSTRPEYLSMTPIEKREAKRQYWEDVITPKAVDQGLDRKETLQARLQFFNEKSLPVKSSILEGLKGTARDIGRFAKRFLPATKEEAIEYGINPLLGMARQTGKAMDIGQDVILNVARELQELRPSTRERPPQIGTAAYKGLMGEERVPGREIVQRAGMQFIDPLEHPVKAFGQELLGAGIEFGAHPLSLLTGFQLAKAGTTTARELVSRPRLVKEIETLAKKKGYMSPDVEIAPIKGLKPGTGVSTQQLKNLKIALEKAPAKVGEAGFLETGVKGAVKPAVKWVDDNFLRSEIDRLGSAAKIVWRTYNIGSKSVLKHDMESLSYSVGKLDEVPNVKESFKHAIYGNELAYKILPKELQDMVVNVKKDIYNQGSILADNIERLTQTESTEIDNKVWEQDELFKDFIEQQTGEKVTPGKPIKPKGLVRIIRNNKDYIFRNYEKDYKPTEEEFDDAVDYFVQQGLDKNNATRQVNDIIAGNPFQLRFGGKATRVSKGSYIARERIPEPLRRIMGERTDPTEVIPMTVARLRSFIAKYALFEKLNKTPDVSRVQRNLTKDPKLNWKRIPDDKLAWGDLGGKYVSPELGELLNEYISYPAQLNRFFTNVGSFVKAGKTIWNPANWLQQITGNIEPSLYAKNFIFSPANTKYYIKAGEIIYTNKHPELKRQLMEHGGYDTTFVNSTDYEDINKFLRNPMDPKTLGEVLKKVYTKGVISTAWASIDQVYKVATVLKNMEKGNMPMDSAIEEMSKWFPMFSEPTRAMRKLTTTTTGRVLRETVFNPFLGFKMARNVVLRNIIADPRRRWVWASLRALRLMPLVLTGIFGTKKQKEELRQWIKEKPVSMLTGADIPLNIGGKVIPVTERHDIFKLIDILNPLEYAGQNIMAGAINDLREKIERGKGGGLSTAVSFAEQLLPTAAGLPIKIGRSLGRIEKAKTPYMKKKEEAGLKEKIISGTLGIRPQLRRSMELETKAKKEAKPGSYWWQK